VVCPWRPPVSPGEVGAAASGRAVGTLGRTAGHQADCRDAFRISRAEVENADPGRLNALATDVFGCQLRAALSRVTETRAEQEARVGCSDDLPRNRHIALTLISSSRGCGESDFSRSG
jgi:hypothetical protein